MTKPRHDVLFRIMALEFAVRDLLSPRKNMIAGIGIKAGDNILDFGCGPGAYLLPAEKLIGPGGHYYALDAQPLAIQSVEDLSRKNKLANVTTILSDCATGLASASIDVIFLYDILHGIDSRSPVFNELQRVLKTGGMLSVNDHHLKNAKIIDKITATGLFKLKTTFSKSLAFARA
jgi:ubiquinone/menaquinone biosynthesis C-methylase UbiE